MSTIAPQRAVRFTVQAPVVAGPLTVFPLVAAGSPVLHFVAFADAVGLGATVTELPDGATVNNLLVCNPLDVPVLLYEGEELLGAQQNRTLDVSVLVTPRTQLTVPVSCVEAGRWDATRSAEAFSAAPQTGHPRLRRLKNAQARAGLEAGGAPAAAQGEVWREVDATSACHGVESSTRAIHDVFENRRELLREMTSSIELCEGQVGALAAIGGRFVVLDHVSEVEAFAALHGPLLQGYALDALGAPEVGPPSLDDAREFVELLLRVPLRRVPAVGIGEGVGFSFGGLGGTGLVYDHEIVTLTAFVDEPAESGALRSAGRVSRPSRRGKRT